jgi:hypothetical protein
MPGRNLRALLLGLGLRLEPRGDNLKRDAGKDGEASAEKKRGVIPAESACNRATARDKVWT